MTWAGTPPIWYRNAVWNRADSKRNGVHYVGDDVIVDLSKNNSFYDLPGARSATFDTGTAGQAITTTQRGSYNAWGFVNGSPTYVSGLQNLVAKIPAGVDQNMGWGLPQSTDVYGRVYWYFTAYPAVLPRITSRLCMSATGKITYVVGLQRPFTTTTPLNQWIRVEWHYDYTAKTYEVRLFTDPDSDIAAETISGSDTGLPGGQSSTVFGNQAAGDYGTDYYLGNVLERASTWPGPFDPDELPGDPLTYTVLDYHGNSVSTGSFEEGHEWFAVQEPGGGWKPGWYTLRVSGPQNDAVFGHTYAATNICFIRDDAHFTPMPAGNISSDVNPDLVMKGVIGLGTSRLSIQHADAPDTGSPNLTEVVAQANQSADYWADNGLPDTERPAREMWCDFPQGTWNAIAIPGSVSGFWGKFYKATGALNGSQVYVTVSAGTNPSTDKVQIHYPNSSTLVETFDNLASQNAAKTTINASSSYVRFFSQDSTLASHPAQQAIGSSYHDGIAEVVSTLYPLGVTRFEGPINEGGIDAEGAHQMMLFQAAVHAGNASAKAIGPDSVTMPPLMNWDSWIAAGGFNYCDEVSFHAYNFCRNGDMNMGLYNASAFVAMMAANGQSAKPFWQTEATHGMLCLYGIFHPRRARVPLMETLIWERMGLPRERNNWWYDRSMGFWDYPSFLENGDNSLLPHAVLARVLAEETWGKNYASALDFGTLGNAIYLGNLYSGSAGKTLVLMAGSYMTGASIALTISGTTDPITVVDGFGNEMIMPQSKGRITIPMTEIPAYVRLPSAASASVYKINGWSPLGTGTSISTSATTKQIDGVSYSVIADGGYSTDADAGAAPTTWAEPPSDVTLIWTNPATIDRVIIWAGYVYSWAGTLIDFDVQTYDGASWTTRKTVTKPSPPYAALTTGETAYNCLYETFWDEQSVFDIELDSTVVCRGVRLHVREASYGGEPYSDAVVGGQGLSVQGFKIQEIAVTDSNRYAGVV